MNQPAVDLDAVQHATAAVQAARHDADFHDAEALRQLLIGTIEDTIADSGTGHHALRRLVMRVHNCFRKVDSVVTVTTPSMHGLLDTIELQSKYIEWLQGQQGVEDGE